ncbi:chemotaxis protein CheR, partial [Burkholderia gladioli]
ARLPAGVPAAASAAPSLAGEDA